MTTASTSPLIAERGSPLSSTLLFALPALALTSKVGLGLVLCIILLIFLRHPRAVLGGHLQHWGELRGVTLAFFLYFLVSLLRMVLDEQALRTLDGPARLLLGLSCIGVMFYLRPRIRYFCLGLCVTTIVAALVACWQVFSGEMPQAVGFTHHAITFGDLSLVSGLMAVCCLGAFRDPRLVRLRWLPGVALLAGMLSTILSGAYGNWMTLPLVLVPLLTYGRRMYGRPLLLILALMLGMVALACVIPATGVAQRIVLTISDVQGYLHGGVPTTSFGIRLELWRAALMMFAEHPWLGVGRDNFDAALHALAASGQLQAASPALAFSSAQNDLLYCLATGGLLDASLLLFMYIAPLRYFIGELRRPDQGQHSLALAGVVLVVAFIGFGLTEAMFWLMMPKVFYVMMLCSLIGMCLAVRHRAPTPRRILITRTDNIGDVVLTLPLAGYLKQLYPQAEIVFLCRLYAAAVVAQCRHVDRVLTVEELGKDVAASLRQADCDTVLFAFPRRELAYAARRAGIGRRVGSTRRVYHWLTCNRLVNFSSPLKRLHEAQLSFKLLLPLGVDYEPPLDEIWKLYGLNTPRHPAADAVLAGPEFKLILHPKSNGNGREWPLEHYTTLARMLADDRSVRVLVTGSPSEGELLAQQAPELLSLPNVENLCGKLDLAGFTALIGGCDGLVASGTGPLHLAAALGRPVAGLFPPLKPIDPARWAALGPRATNLVQPTGCGHCADPAKCSCMLAITPQQVYDVIRSWR
ncbi:MULTISPECIES: glycosyltransferase family 9 protein [unclassified Duganella]|uniref:glycosyltransferase family 9 protein n=1 Tax=unclassified Duganella TaxID=2636909 RepID=UPI0008803798|nr:MULTISPECIES: glycosyltransferase family 9 protein [unclassified Duganella]SDF93681.1 ADP-heptose:LPS heptosyltransferase [Duganella sp. OV458]SDJ11118.1 ADP-heptose:LPS heptosyltransferase [Duganella sp. OV510]